MSTAPPPIWWLQPHKDPFILEIIFTCAAMSICLLLHIQYNKHLFAFVYLQLHRAVCKFIISITSDIGDAWIFWLAGEYWTCLSSASSSLSLFVRVSFPKYTKFPKEVDYFPQSAGHILLLTPIKGEIRCLERVQPARLSVLQCTHPNWRGGRKKKKKKSNSFNNSRSKTSFFLWMWDTQNSACEISPFSSQVVLSWLKYVVCWWSVFLHVPYKPMVLSLILHRWRQ